MTDSMQSKGGKARAAKLTKEERSAVSSAAAQARWLKATHQGVLHLGEAEIPCYVLSDGRRVLSRGQMVSALGMKQGGNPAHGMDRLANFAAGKGIKPFLSNELQLFIHSPIPFRIGEVQAFGFEAVALSALCEGILEADRAKVLQTQQSHIAERAWKLMKGFSRVGIIALVDEATGYQYDRARDELQKILKAYINDELLPWVKRFPHEFYKQVFRLHGWEYKEGSVKGPMYMGKFINKVIYDQLPPGVREELVKKNPAVDGKRKHRHHQFLTEDTGITHLDRQIVEVTTAMKLSRDKTDFEQKFTTLFPRSGQQLHNGLGAEMDE